MNKQKLQEQIDTMRAELAKMETELAECEKVELEKTYYLIMSDGRLQHKPTVVWKHYIEAGASRATKELAEIASKNMITRNKLEAYVHQIDPEWRDRGIGTIAYHLKYDSIGIAYAYDTNRRVMGAVYMSKSTAEQICKWLNDGRIEL